MGDYENDMDQTLVPWDLGAAGRGFLLIQLSGDVPELRLWEVDADGRPFHAEAEEFLGIDPERVLASLIIEPDGETTVMGLVDTSHGMTCEEWVWALEERLSNRSPWPDFGWNEDAP